MIDIERVRRLAREREAAPREAPCDRLATFLFHAEGLIERAADGAPAPSNLADWVAAGERLAAHHRQITALRLRTRGKVSADRLALGERLAAVVAGLRALAGPGPSPGPAD